VATAFNVTSSFTIDQQQAWEAKSRQRVFRPPPIFPVWTLFLER